MRRVRFLAALCCALAVTSATVTHASATKTRTIAGVGMIRLGDSAKIGSEHLTRSAYVILSPFNGYLARGIRAGNPNTTVLAYKSSMDLKSNAACTANPAGCDTGITFAEAQAHDAASPKDPWILRDSHGNPMTGGYPDNYLGDVGSASFQTRWLANVSTFLRANGLSGVFIDNVLGDLSGWSQGRFPTKYANDPAWEDAMASFVSRVGPALQRQGFFVAVNAYKPYPDDISWWRRIARWTDGLTDEFWQQNPNDVRQLYTSDAPSWTGHWDYWQQLVGVAQKNGSSFFGISYGDTSDTRLMQYGRASFLIAWNGRGGAYFFNPLAAADPWQEAWTADIGRPVASRYRVGSGWRREFSNGTVVVNPSSTKSQSFTFAHAYVTADGQSVKQLTLAPTSAAILESTAPVSVPKGTPATPKRGIMWDGKRVVTRHAMLVWLRAHHVTWRTWAGHHPSAARSLTG
jgi:hypothetical protein